MADAGVMIPLLGSNAPDSTFGRTAVARGRHEAGIPHMLD